MRISDILNTGGLTLSFEMFPPKERSGLEKSYGIADRIARNRPSFISVTYGAAGGASEYTVNVADNIQKHSGVPSLAHLTCIVSSKDKINAVLDDLEARGIENILALRGDIPPGQAFPGSGHFMHASDLMAAVGERGCFCVGGACYPEGHPESASRAKDIDALKIKRENGCSFLTTQMFFDNDAFYNFMFRMLRGGVDIPVIAGIMPVVDALSIPRIIALSGATLPRRFTAAIDRFADDPEAMRQAGVAYATDQIIDLASNGVGHVHVYTMNNPDIADDIARNLSHIFIPPRP
ncbi:MAG: methylenetetrahydrofolate reductase [Clostridiales Family XIII bacterium]|jgi:methylenetetrahydrofolate reductase (NADPH)|nr:methylenetetrahydrofolate reductase [Clostridiales Family XIII bacterium]